MIFPPVATLAPARPKQPGLCLHPSPWCSGKKDTEDSRGKQPLFFFFLLTCVYTCHLEQGQKRLSGAGAEKVVPFYPKIWDRNSIPLQATANWFILTSRNFIHSISRWGQLTEQVNSIESRGHQDQVSRHCRIRLLIMLIPFWYLHIYIYIYVCVPIYI